METRVSELRSGNEENGEFERLWAVGYTVAMGQKEELWIFLAIPTRILYNKLIMLKQSMGG